MHRTWAPRGETPILRHWYRHDRISVISGVSISAVRRRYGLYFHCHAENIRARAAVRFLQHLLRHLPGPVIVLWDNSKTHHGPLIRALLARHQRLRLEYFPAYAPELNPDEGIWAQAKAALANSRPDTTLELLRAIIATMSRLRRSPRHLRACITHALPMHLP